MGSKCDISRGEQKSLNEHSIKCSFMHGGLSNPLAFLKKGNEDNNGNVKSNTKSSTRSKNNVKTIVLPDGRIYNTTKVHGTKIKYYDDARKIDLIARKARVVIKHDTNMAIANKRDHSYGIKCGKISTALSSKGIDLSSLDDGTVITGLNKSFFKRGFLSRDPNHKLVYWIKVAPYVDSTSDFMLLSCDAIQIRRKPEGSDSSLPKNENNSSNSLSSVSANNSLKSHSNSLSSHSNSLSSGCVSNSLSSGCVSNSLSSGCVSNSLTGGSNSLTSSSLTNSSLTGGSNSLLTSNSLTSNSLTGGSNGLTGGSNGLTGGSNGLTSNSLTGGTNGLDGSNNLTGGGGSPDKLGNLMYNRIDYCREKNLAPERIKQLLNGPDRHLYLRYSEIYGPNCKIYTLEKDAYGPEEVNDSNRAKCISIISTLYTISWWNHPDRMVKFYGNCHDLDLSTACIIKGDTKVFLDSIPVDHSHKIIDLKKGNVDFEKVKKNTLDNIMNAEDTRKTMRNNLLNHGKIAMNNNNVNRGTINNVNRAFNTMSNNNLNRGNIGLNSNRLNSSISSSKKLNNESGKNHTKSTFNNEFAEISRRLSLLPRKTSSKGKNSNAIGTKPIFKNNSSYKKESKRMCCRPSPKMIMERKLQDNYHRINLDKIKSAPELYDLGSDPKISRPISYKDLYKLYVSNFRSLHRIRYNIIRKTKSCCSFFSSSKGPKMEYVTYHSADANSKNKKKLVKTPINLTYLKPLSIKHCTLPYYDPMECEPLLKNSPEYSITPPPKMQQKHNSASKPAIPNKHQGYKRIKSCLRSVFSSHSHIAVGQKVEKLSRSGSSEEEEMVESKITREASVNTIDSKHEGIKQLDDKWYDVYAMSCSKTSVISTAKFDYSPNKVQTAFFPPSILKNRRLQYVSNQGNDANKGDSEQSFSHRVGSIIYRPKPDDCGVNNNPGNIRSKNAKDTSASAETVSKYVLLKDTLEERFKSDEILRPKVSTLHPEVPCPEATHPEVPILHPEVPTLPTKVPNVPQKEAPSVPKEDAYMKLAVKQVNNHLMENDDQAKKDCKETKKDCKETKKDCKETKKDCKETKKDCKETKKDCKETKRDCKETKRDCKETKKDCKEVEVDCEPKVSKFTRARDSILITSAKFSNKIRDSLTLMSPKSFINGNTPLSPSDDENNMDLSVVHNSSSNATISPIVTPVSQKSCSDVINTAAPTSDKKPVRVSIIEELIKTEEDYVRDLDLLVNKTLHTVRISDVLSSQLEKELFSNIEDILTINSCFLSKLKERMNQYGDRNIENLEIADILLDFIRDLHRYSYYCANYPLANKLYMKLTDLNVGLRSVIEEVFSRPEFRDLDFLSFLIKPVQRICKYPLLFRDLFRNTSKLTLESLHIKLCIKELEEIMYIVNHSTQYLDADSIFDMVESKVIAPLPVSIRGCHILRGGYLNLVSGFRTQKCYCLLLEDVFLVFKEINGSSFDLISAFPIEYNHEYEILQEKQKSVIRNSKPTLKITVLNYSLSHIFNAVSEEECNEWIKSFKYAFKRCRLASSRSRMYPNIGSYSRLSSASKCTWYNCGKLDLYSDRSSVQCSFCSRKLSLAKGIHNLLQTSNCLQQPSNINKNDSQEVATNPENGVYNIEVVDTQIGANNEALDNRSVTFDSWRETLCGLGVIYFFDTFSGETRWIRPPPCVVCNRCCATNNDTTKPEGYDNDDPAFDDNPLKEDNNASYTYNSEQRQCTTYTQSEQGNDENCKLYSYISDNPPKHFSCEEQPNKSVEDASKYEILDQDHETNSSSDEFLEYHYLNSDQVQCVEPIIKKSKQQRCEESKSKVDDPFADENSVHYDKYIENSLKRGENSSGNGDNNSSGNGDNNSSGNGDEKSSGSGDEKSSGNTELTAHNCIPFEYLQKETAEKRKRSVTSNYYYHYSKITPHYVTKFSSMDAWVAPVSDANVVN